jgi:hypothetical protein
MTVGTKREAMNTFSISRGLNIDGKVSNCRRVVGILSQNVLGVLVSYCPVVAKCC